MCSGTLPGALKEGVDMSSNDPIVPQWRAPCLLHDAGDPQASYDTAIRENPRNAVVTPTPVSSRHSHEDDSELRLLVDHTRYWAGGRTLKIAFMGDPPDFIMAPIIAAANKWLPHINLKFEFVTQGVSDIRINLGLEGNWSAVGTDALLIEQDKPTLEFHAHKLFSATGAKPLPELEGIVLHEFGHVLGALHEHQHPDADIPWNVPLLKEVLKKQGLSDEVIRQNILDTCAPADFHYAPYDRDSIMHYDVPNGLTLGEFEIINRGTLSLLDIETLSAIYPRVTNSLKITAPAAWCHVRHSTGAQAYSAAVSENPINSVAPAQAPGGHQNSPDGSARLTTSFTKYWGRGRTLRIRFLGQVPDILQQLIFNTACKWSPHINLGFVLEPADKAEIRIALDQPFHWSAVGTDALLAYGHQQQPTMGFDLTRLLDVSRLVAVQGLQVSAFDIRNFLAPEFERVVLHEFGHVLGAEHEHQHPDANIPWDEEAVLRYYADRGHSETFIRQNILDSYQSADFSFFDYDPLSIMHYDVPNEHTRGNFMIDNAQLGLSEKDIALMAKIYGNRPNSRRPQARNIGRSPRQFP
jgi:hypothetical protein